MCCLSYISKHLMLLFNHGEINTQKGNRISKHLMLLFNTFSIPAVAEAFPFQNISCYCLTENAVDPPFVVWISKHLMLLFNPTILRHFLMVFFKNQRFYVPFHYFFQVPPQFTVFLKKYIFQPFLTLFLEITW